MAHIGRCKHGLGLAECNECFPKTKLDEGWKEGYEKMNKPHKWAKEIKAWADGAEIEVRWFENKFRNRWYKAENPDWNTIDSEYRIKPQPKEPQYLYVYEDSFFSLEEKDTRAGTRIMNKPIKEWEKIYIGKIKLEVDDE